MKTTTLHPLAESFIAAIRENNEQKCKAAFYKAHDPKILRQIIDATIQHARTPPKIQRLLVQLWQDHSGGIQRAAGTPERTASFLRAALPQYRGGPVKLYRGQGLMNYQAGNLGFSWSSQDEIAAQFVEEFHQHRRGGAVIIETIAPPAAIISAAHFIKDYYEEAEFVIDWLKLGEVREVRRISEAAEIWE